MMGHVVGENPFALPVALSGDVGGDGLRFGLIDPRRIDGVEEQRWHDLASRAQAANPFAQPWFIRASVRHLDGEGHARLAVVSDADGAWLGCLPVARAWFYGRVPLPHWQAWRHPNLFTGSPLVRPGAEQGFWLTLLEGLAQGGGGSNLLRLQDMPLDDPATMALSELTGSGQALLRVDRRQVRAALLGDAPLKADERRRIASLERRLESELGAICFEIVRDPARISGLLEQFLVLEGAGWKGEAGSAMALCQAKRDFLAEVTGQGAGDGWVELATLAAGDTMLAMSVHFRKGRFGAGFKMAIDETGMRHSPGVLLFNRLRQAACESGVSLFDSCSREGQQPVSRLWPDRRQLIDCGVALAGRRSRAAMAVLALCDRLRNRPAA